jgi:Tol biopolymer transport system component
VALGPGTRPKFSPDGAIVAAPILTRPPQVGLSPIGTGDSRRLPVGDIVSLEDVRWFPDGKHLLLIGATEGQPLRTYEMDLAGGKPQALGPADFIGDAVANDGKRIAGHNDSGAALVFDRETQKVEPIPGIGPEDRLQSWTEDGQGVLVSADTLWEAKVYRVDVATGKRTLLQTVEPIDKAGSVEPVSISYSERGKAYAYGTIRVLSILYVVQGLE